MIFNNPLGYTDSRNIRNNSSGKCDGVCEKCEKSRFCVFSNAEKIRSGYSDNGDDIFNTQMLDAFAFRTRYRNTGSSESGFSNPYKSGGRNYSSGDYRKDLGINDAGGFHGEYSGVSGDDSYSKMTPRGGKSSYCSGGGCK